jgi:Mrp family chromosome partitioning ATPase/capsular polysaccharide biosynthesis protein
VDLQKLARIMRRSLGFLVIATLAGAAIGVALGLYERSEAAGHRDRTYFAATETLGYDANAAGQSGDSVSALATIGTFVTSPDVTDEVGKALGGDGAALAGHITTVARPNNYSIDVTAVADTAADAERLATKFSDATIVAYGQDVESRSANQATQLSKRLADLTARREAVAQQLQNPSLSQVERDTLNAQSDALVNQYRIAYDRFINLDTSDSVAPPLFTLARPRAIRIDAATFDAALERGRSGQNHIVAGDPTTAASTATGSSAFEITGPVALGVIGAVLGFLLALGVVLGRARFDSRLHTRTDFEDAFALPILGGVPIMARDEAAEHFLTVTEKPYSPGAEVFRAVRSALLLLGTDHPDREGALIVMVASAQPKEGKSATCANLAAAFAESGRSVLAVNCDHRRPTLHHYFKLANEAGRVQTTNIQGLSIVTNVTTTKTSPGRVGAEQRSFIELQRPHFDVILLDTAPLLSTSDPIDIVSVADFMLLVGRPGYTERDHARQMMELLARHRVEVAGLLMTAVDPVSSDYYHYYSTYSSFSAMANSELAAGASDAGAVSSTTPTVDARRPNSKRHLRRKAKTGEPPSDGH